MGGIHFGIDTEQVGKVRGFDEALVEHLLSVVVELVDPDSSPDSDCFVVIFSDHSVGHFGEPPDT